MSLLDYISNKGYISAQEVENVTGPNGVGRIPDLIRNVRNLARERERERERGTAVTVKFSLGHGAEAGQLHWEIEDEDQQ